jgi:hypothetical protein
MGIYSGFQLIRRLFFQWNRNAAESKHERMVEEAEKEKREKRKKEEGMKWKY